MLIGFAPISELIRLTLSDSWSSCSGEFHRMFQVSESRFKVSTRPRAPTSSSRWSPRRSSSRSTLRSWRSCRNFRKSERWEKLSELVIGLSRNLWRVLRFAVLKQLPSLIFQDKFKKMVQYYWGTLWGLHHQSISHVVGFESLSAIWHQFACRLRI